MADPALGLRFKVRIDAMDMGNWQKCDGLSMEYDIYDYNEGGENGYVHHIPGRVKFQNVKLTRPVDASSSTVAMWVNSLQVRMAPSTAEIAVLDPSGETMARWELTGVYPVRWSGPSLDVGSTDWATETLELSHNGFLTL